MKRPLQARLYLICEARPDLTEFLEAAIRGGVEIVQIREKQHDDGKLLVALEDARTVTERLGVPLVVNDRPDLALLSNADYVHVGQDDLPVEAARQFEVGVGLSTHSRRQIDEATADYIGVGPVFATPTKAGRRPVGLELVRYATVSARQPWFAIGGIDEGNVSQVVVAGAERIAVVRAIGDSNDPEGVARLLRGTLGAD